MPLSNEPSALIARIVRLPAVHFLTALVVGSVAHARFPLSLGIPSYEAGLFSGGAMLVVAGVIGWSALSEMRKYRTTVEPGRKPTALVTSGIFSFSRNPLYLTLLLLLAAIAVMADSLWLLLAAALLGLVLDRFVIRSEERMIEEAFGEQYLAYKRRVRRWL